MSAKVKMEVGTLIKATVGRTIEFNKNWYKFEYGEERTVFGDIDKEREKLWNRCIKEVEDQIEELKKFLGV